MFELIGKVSSYDSLNILESSPVFDLEPKIIFMARAWNPDSVENKSQKESIEEINETRAFCIRTLRKEFRNKFYGGLAFDDYSNKYFKDILLPDQSLSQKKNYLNLLKEFPICIATTGLNNSNGWKLGEYVAFSKAIISEPLFFDVPGSFQENNNYLVFTNSESLLSSAEKLIEDKDFRCQMMQNNYRYYQSSLKPDSLILNTLTTVIQNTDSSVYN